MAVPETGASEDTLRLDSLELRQKLVAGISKALHDSLREWSHSQDSHIERVVASTFEVSGTTPQPPQEPRLHQAKPPRLDPRRLNILSSSDMKDHSDFTYPGDEPYSDGELYLSSLSAAGSFALRPNGRSGSHRSSSGLRNSAQSQLDMQMPNQPIILDDDDKPEKADDESSSSKASSKEAGTGERSSKEVPGSALRRSGRPTLNQKKTTRFASTCERFSRFGALDVDDELPRGRDSGHGGTSWSLSWTLAPSMTDYHRGKRLSLNSYESHNSVMTSDSEHQRLRGTQNIQEIGLHEWKHCRRRLRHILEAQMFEYAVAACICINAVLIGIQADHAIKNPQASPPIVFRIVDMIFCVIFIVEVSLRLLAYRASFFSRGNWKWNVFDLLLVLSQVFEEIIQNTGGASSSMVSGMGFLRVIRILRLLRVLRVIRMMRFVRELRQLVISIAGSLRNLVWTMCLIILLMYIVGVYFVQLISDHVAANSLTDFSGSALDLYFGSLLRALLSLFQAMTGGVDWDNLASPLMDNISPMMGFIFALYIAFAVLAMMNVVTGVFVETALQTAKEEKDTDLLKNMGRLFVKGHEQAGSEITWQEFSDKLLQPEVLHTFKDMDFNVSEAQELFALLDVESTGAVNAEEFLMGCLRLRGNAKAVDLATLMYNNKRMANQLGKAMLQVREDLLSLRRDLQLPSTK